MSESLNTTVRKTTTYVRKSVAMALYTQESPHDAIRSNGQWEAMTLLLELIEAAETLSRFAILENEFEVAEARQKAKDIARFIRARELAEKMSVTSGRTEAEKELFDEKRRALLHAVENRDEL